MGGGWYERLSVRVDVYGRSLVTSHGLHNLQHSERGRGDAAHLEHRTILVLTVLPQAYQCFLVLFISVSGIVVLICVCSITRTGC